MRKSSPMMNCSISRILDLVFITTKLGSSFAFSVWREREGGREGERGGERERERERIQCT